MVVNVVLGYLARNHGTFSSVCSRRIRRKNHSLFQAGDTITVYYEIREGEKVRTQFFKGVVIQIKGTEAQKHSPFEKYLEQLVLSVFSRSICPPFRKSK